MAALLWHTWITSCWTKWLNCPVVTAVQVDPEPFEIVLCVSGSSFEQFLGRSVYSTGETSDSPVQKPSNPTFCIWNIGPHGNLLRGSYFFSQLWSWQRSFCCRWASLCTDQIGKFQGWYSVLAYSFFFFFPASFQSFCRWLYKPKGWRLIVFLNELLREFYGKKTPK